MSALAESLRVAVLARRGKVEGNEIRFRCPYPERHSHGDADPSARYNPLKNCWTCDVCGAGGGAPDLAALLGIEVPAAGDLNGRPPGVPATWHGKQFGAAWCYRDRGGRELGWVVRYNDPRGIKEKECIPFFKREREQWKAGAPADPRPLFGQEVLAAQPEALVWAVEGEPCAAAIHRLAGVAVTSQGGAKAAAYADWAPLRGRHVHIWPDNDTPGVHYGADVLRLVREAGVASVDAVDIAVLNLAEKGDVVDWLAAHPGATLRDLEALPVTISFLGAPPRAASEGSAWPPRQPLPAPEMVPGLPAELVPGPLRGWLVEAAGRASIPLELIAAPTVVVAGSIVGRSVGIRPESTRNSWTVVPNLWGGIVAPPGLLKSHAIGEALAPLRPLEAEAREEYQKAKQGAEIKKAALTAELGRLKSRKSGDVDRTGIGEAMQELSECEAWEKRYSTADATIEKLGEVLADNPRGILLVRDEIAGWLAGFERPGREGERAFYLEAWNGTGSFTVDRIGRGTIHIPALCVSVVGSIQPGRLSSYIAEALAGGSGADGLLQRFQVLVWPDGLPEYHRTEGGLDLLARERAFAVYRTLDRLQACNLGATLGGTGGIPCVVFDHEAQELFDCWRDELESRLRGEDLQRTPAFCAHLAKYRSLMPALALLFHLVEVVDTPSGGFGGGVSLRSARLAAAWCEYLETHARKLYRRELAGGTEAARLLAGKIEAGDVRDGELVRDLYRREWSGLRTPEAVWQAVNMLERLGWVRTTELTTGGRPSYAVHFHPELIGGGQ